MALEGHHHSNSVSSSISNQMALPATVVGRLVTPQTSATTRDRNVEVVASMDTIQKMCTAKRVDQVEDMELPPGSGAEDETEEEDPLLNVQMVKPFHKAGIQLALRVAGQPLTMELDTGASVSLVSKQTWKNTQVPMFDPLRNAAENILRGGPKSSGLVYRGGVLWRTDLSSTPRCGRQPWTFLV